MIVTRKPVYRIFVDTPEFENAVNVVAYRHGRGDFESVYPVELCVFPTLGDAVEAVKNSLYVKYTTGYSFPGIVVLDDSTPSKFRIFENTLEDQELVIHVAGEHIPVIERDEHDE